MIMENINLNFIKRINRNMKPKCLNVLAVIQKAKYYFQGY